MKKELKQEIEIPEGIETEVKDGTIIMKKGDKTLKRAFVGFSVKTEGSKIILSHKKATKVEKKMLMTTLAHVKNMIRGLEDGFEYLLEICSVHFPMTVNFDKAKGEITIKNFLGERKPRIGKINGLVDIDIKGNIVTVSSHDIEVAGQASAVIERTCRLVGKDRRIFQDGIFITKKPGRVFK